MIYRLYRRPGTDEPPQDCASLADALEASCVPPGSWCAVVSTHPDEIVTFRPSRQFIRAPGVAAEFCARERLAGSLPATGATP